MNPAPAPPDLRVQPRAEPSLGPWTVVECAGLHDFMVTAPDWTVAEMCGEREQAYANAHLIGAAPDLLGEHRAWASMFGEALLLALQGDYSKVDELAAVARFEFPDGTPHLKSEAIEKAQPSPKVTSQ